MATRAKKIEIKNEGENIIIDGEDFKDIRGILIKQDNFKNTIAVSFSNKDHDIYGFVTTLLDVKNISFSLFKVEILDGTSAKVELYFSNPNKNINYRIVKSVSYKQQ